MAAADSVVDGSGVDRERRLGSRRVRRRTRRKIPGPPAHSLEKFDQSGLDLGRQRHALVDEIAGVGTAGHLRDHLRVERGEGPERLGFGQSLIADESVTPPTFPMSVHVKGTEGAPKTQWNMTVAQEKFMTPGLVAAALSGALEATANERRDVTWKLNSKVTLSKYGTIDLEDVGVAVGGTLVAPVWLAAPALVLVGSATVGSAVVVVPSPITGNCSKPKSTRCLASTQPPLPEPP